LSAKDYENRVRDIGCIVCLHLGVSGSPASIHHVESIRDGLSSYAVVPLCPGHHTGPEGVHGLSRRGFEARYKLTEIDLLAMVNRELNR
jgi:Recombination enhancement, RecA-dependent nuclease